MLPAPPPLVAPAPFEAALERSVAGLCRQASALMELGNEATPAQVKALRVQVEALRSAVRRNLGAGHGDLPLLDAALGALQATAGQEVQGERRYGFAARELALRWARLQRSLPADSPERAPELERLALLAELAGLRGTPWREKALFLRNRLAKGPDRALEVGLAALVEDRYGPWLTVAEVDPMLDACQALVQAWQREPDGAALTRRVVELGLKSEAGRVWRLAARKGDGRFREAVAGLLGRMDAGVLARHEAALASLDEALLDGPLDAPVRELLGRVLRHAEGQPRMEPLRRRLLQRLGDVAGEEALLAAMLPRAAAGEAVPLLRRAAELLGRRGDAELLGTSLTVLEALPAPDGELLEAFLPLLPPGEAREALVARRLSLEDGGSAEGRWALLERLGRFRELEAQLGPLRPGEDLERLALRLRCARGLGREEQAREAALACLEACLRLPAGAPLPSLPGLAAGAPLLAGQREDLVEALARRFGAQALSGQEALLAREPGWILAALDPLARTCPGRLEERARWRLARIAGRGAAAELKALRRELEAGLGEDHPLVAETLLKEAEVAADPEPALLERARGILERREAPLERRIAVQDRLLGLQAQEGNGEAAVREGFRLLELLEAQAEPDPEALGACSVGLGLQHLRQERFDAALDLMERLGRAVVRLPKERQAEFHDALSRVGHQVRRAARLQAQLRAAGL